MSKRLTQKRLKNVLNYDPETGIFVWIVPRQGVKTSRPAGTLNKVKGYRQIQVDGRLYGASRLAWLYVEGYLPENDIDHINRIKNDDRWKNLRHVSHQCNSRNCNISKRNKSGIIGISWDRTATKWRAQITISGKCINLGRFSSKLKATIARWNAEVKHDFPNCNTTSTAYLFLQENKI